jgi:hypothetical protein
MINQIASALVFMDKSTRHNVVMSAFDEYCNIMSGVAFDIYRSCIQDYYAQYIPTVYTRHGDIAGANLYLANNISYSDLVLHLSITPDPLKPYSDEDYPDRDYILTNVMNGIRGGKNMRLERGWPKKWSTSYPNRFSQFGSVWSSSKTTIEDILVDFETNAADETSSLLFACLAKRLGI